MKKRILSILLICCMVLTMLPATALAEESGQTGGGVTASGLCEHHPAHDDECGYTEGTAGTPCSHEHTDDCYTEVTDCVHEHTEDCYPQNSVSGNNATSSNADEPTECTHVCSEESGCITKQLNCQHEHDEDCGYTPATAGTPCGYVCEICGAEGNAAEAMTVERVQAMIDALPDAEEITEDNAEEVTAQLEAIDEAKAELTDEEIDELDITRYMAAAAALGSLAAPMLLANAAPAEQFNLTPGGTYWFDLSGENIPGTVNSSVPDTTLHYVPFTYAGTVEAYKLTSEMQTTEDYATQNKYPHSLFVADYAVTHTVSWYTLKTAGLIFGRRYTGGSVDYTLRAPSGGSRSTGSGDSERGTPQSNEWDAVLDKNSGYIKNWNSMLSWGQDSDSAWGGGYRVTRGWNSARFWILRGTAYQYASVGFRPVLEVLNTDALGSDGLKAVTLDLNGGKLGGSTDNIQIIVKNGAAFTAPASDGLTRPDGDTGSFFIWKGSNGNLYAPGDSVPAGVTLLTAKWVNSVSSVSTEDELREALDAGETSIKLVGDINLSSTLDLTDKNITLDLNGYVLTGNIQLADSSALPDSILTLIDSNPTATHADSSLPAGGVVKGNITLTRGSGSVSHLYANGGTVTGQTSLPSYAGGIFCTSDTPTAFTGYVGNYGEIHGGIFYAGINESCIKENTVTFMNGDSRYALEVVASGNKVVAPVSTPLKAGYDFVGWYNGDTKYEFNQTITSDITLTAQWTPAEQFNLTPGGTYWFDLSGENIPGTVNTGTSYGAVSMPDTTLHYVPFTYAGTVDAYKLTSAMATTEEYAEQNTYSHSLFVADYAVTHTVSWDELNNAGLIFGKSYTGGSVDYTLRAPSVGSWYTGSGDSAHGTPQSNEWDAVLDKNSSYIKNWYRMLSWGQDTARSGSSYHALRGYSSARNWDFSSATYQYVIVGFRPVLEVLNTDTLGSDGLKAVTLALNGGKLGGSADDIQIIVKNGAAFTAPASDGLTAPQVGYSAQWQDSDGNLYAPGDSVPAGVTTLTAQWTDTYTVTLHLNDGTIANGKDVTEYTYGTGATLPTADDITRAGHTFEGWYEDENFSGSPVTEISATDTGKKEFYAKWEQKANAGLSVDAVPEKTYGDPAFQLNVHADSDGKVTYSSDNVNTATVDENGTVTIHQVGTATLTIRIAETAKYLPGEVTVTITVVRKNATLTVEKLTYSVTYGDADFIIGYASEGESSVTFTSSNEKVATVDKNGVVHIVSAGSATITLNMEQSGNYNAVSKKVEVIVAPKAITVTADNQTKIYDEDDPELTYTAVGLVGEDTLTGITLTRADGENAGEYDITASQADGANPNYEITFVPGTLTIAARDIADAEVELGAALIANGKTQEQNIQRVTVKNAKGEELEVTYTVTGNQATEPGAYTITITGTGNFTGTVTKTFVIAPAADSKVDTNESGDVVIGKGTISVEVVQETGAPEAEIRTGKAAIIEMLVASGDLTAEELSQVGDGASIRVLLKVTVASTTITEESKAQIEKAAEGYVIGQYIDISLFKQTICNGQAGELIRLTGTYEEMEISLVVPENLLNRDNSVTRTFWLIRNHDGKVEFLPATYDAQTNTLTFKTDKFSDYAIVYKDAKKAAENPTKPDNTATGTSPQTGDPAILWIWFVLLFISCGGVITTIYIGKRKKDKAE
ncbi:MBG domain-containing protein [Oliverpabstia intestinalis]|uniref:MBG domain-containing protein n=1 Tax=Oliverpabstia intestinalis TaxID=2606633 RepID=UPI003F8B902A